MIKTTGKEFKAFYDDKVFWPEGWFHDDGAIIINGDEDADPMTAEDNAEVIIDGGVVFKGDYNQEGDFMETHFKKWRKAQKYEYLTVEIPKGTADKVKEFVKALKKTGD